MQSALNFLTMFYTNINSSFLNSSIYKSNIFFENWHFLNESNKNVQKFILFFDDKFNWQGFDRSK